MKSSLQKIRILDLTRVVPGPYGSLILSDLGCDVVKVEEPGKGDYTRQMEPTTFYGLNRNKKSITLNLKSPEGKKIFYALARKADVLLESFRPGVVKKLGIDYENIHRLNRGIIYCSITGYGQDGPYQRRPGHDLDYMALAGAFSISPDVPHVLPLAISDLNSGMFAAISILAALFERERGGEGQYIDVSLMDSALSWMSTKILKKSKRAEIKYAGFGIFKTKDDRYLSLSAIEDNFWNSLCGVLARAGFAWKYRDLTMGERTQKLLEINKSLEEIIETRDLKDWVELFGKNDIPFAPVNTLEEIPLDPQIASRGLIFEMDHPRLGKMKQIKFPAKLSLTPATVRTPPPELGEHTEEILMELGYKQEEIDSFRKAGVI